MAHVRDKVVLRASSSKPTVLELWCQRLPIRGMYQTLKHDPVFVTRKRFAMSYGMAGLSCAMRGPAAARNAIDADMKRLVCASNACRG